MIWRCGLMCEAGIIRREMDLFTEEDAPSYRGGVFYILLYLLHILT